MITELPEIKVINYPIEKLIPYPRNNKLHPPEQVELIVKSIQKNGFRNPILINSDGVIIAGHGRRLACLELKYTHIPAIVITEQDRLDEMQFRILDNKSAESKYDTEALRLDFQELIDNKMDLSLTGFGTREISKIMNVAILDPNDLRDVEPDSINAIKTEIKKGDLFQLGKHRLICGDSTDLKTYEILLSGRKADMMETDPPYNVNYEEKFKHLTGHNGSINREGSQIQNDSMSKDQFYQFLKSFYGAANQSLKPGAAIYVFHSESEGLNFRAAMIDSGFKFSETLVWVKNSFVMRRSDYHYQHEPILYGWKEGAAHYFIYDRSQATTIEYDKDIDPKKLSKSELIAIVQKLKDSKIQDPSTVQRCDRPSKSDDHPTQKPVKLVGRFIINSSKQDDIVLDPFGGSGTTIIACEQLQRSAHCIELDEKYCQVIINRWQKLTGKVAEKIN